MLRVSCPATDMSALESGGTQLLWYIPVDDDMWAMIVGAGSALSPTNCMWLLCCAWPREPDLLSCMFPFSCILWENVQLYGNKSRLDYI